MKTFVKYFALALGAIVLVFSCDKNSVIENEKENDNVENNSTIVTLNCTIYNPVSKVSMDTSNGKTVWDDGDEILIHGEYIGLRDALPSGATDGVKESYSTLVTLNAATDLSNSDKTATISFAVDSDGMSGIVPYVRSGRKSRFYGAYPASSLVDASGYHTYEYTRFNNTNQPIMVGYDDNAGNMVFRNLCAAISFVIPGVKDYDYYRFYGNNNEVLGYTCYAARLYLKTDDTEYTEIPYNYSGETSGPIKEIVGTAVCDGTTCNTFYVPVAIGNTDIPFSKGFTIEFIKDGDIVEYVTTKTDFTLNPGDYLAIGNVSGGIKTYVHSHSSALATSNDLSTANGTANCYMIAKDVAANAGAVFKFPHVIGNGSTDVGSVYDACVLWATKNTDTAPGSTEIIAAVDYDDTYIYFQMPDPIVAGNAVIAAKNAMGTILWSWHIWVPETIVAPSSLSDHGIYSHKLMDKNLGALIPATTASVQDVTSYGLLYQWGRKDPFVGSKAKNSSSIAAVYGTAPSANDGQLTLAQSIQNPTKLGYQGAGGKDWITPSNNELWKDESKSLYDPCPPGYRVPARIDSDDYHKDWTGVTGFEYNSTNKYCALGSPLAVFPLCGQYSDWDGPWWPTIGSVQERTSLWTAHKNSDDTAYFVEIKSGSSAKLNNAGKERAATVRCCVDE